ncbi:MAG: hypothetical protein QM754_08545 [Tepidisphaeraceae bacterium]
MDYHVGPVTEAEQQAWDRVLRPWWVKVLAGGLFLLFGFFQYLSLAAVDAGTKDVDELHGLTWLLYTIGGTWLAVGVTAVVGGGLIAWGSVQLSRSAGSGTLQSPLQQFQAEQEVDPDEMPIGRALYTAFYKPILGVWTLLHIGGALVCVKWLWPDTANSFAAVAVLLAVMLAFIDLELLARAIGWDEGPILDWSQQVTWIAAIGFLLALSLASWLAVVGGHRVEDHNPAHHKKDPFLEELKQKASAECEGGVRIRSNAKRNATRQCRRGDDAIGAGH